MIDDGRGGALMEYTHLLMRIFLAAYLGYVCFDTVNSSTTFTDEQKTNLKAACLGAAGTYYGRGGKF